VENRQPANPVVEVRGLTKSFGETHAVQGLDLQVARATITAVLGPNGAGKTTTLEIISGLQRADSGQVLVLGESPWQAGRVHRSRVGVMLQSGGIWPSATANQALEHIARFYDDPLDTSNLMDRLRLGQKQARTAFRRLSGGEQQRVKLACAIVGRPEIVILDEPSSGLDPATRLEIWGLINELKSEGTTVLLSTHSMEEAEALADHAVIVSEGRTVLSGNPATLTQQVGDECLWFRCSISLDQESLLAELPDGHELIEEPLGRFRLQGATVTPETIATVTSWCADHGVMTTDLHVRQRSLEDVFLEVTNK
jgi:ABC-2 type transport system ATP-binding protein